MIKAHSMGIGDILRSSAAWRVMKDHWPGVELHLLFLSRHAGYPSEALIAHHHLLSSATFLTIREGEPYADDVRKVSNFKILRQVWQLARRLQPDCVIDFEWAGSRTSVVTWLAAWASRAHSVGIAQFPLRSWFYQHAAASSAQYALRHGLSEPFDYTHRDFVALAALGLERGDAAIELKVDESARQKILAFLPPKGGQVLRVGLNIGCATFGAAHKRMNLSTLAEYFKRWMNERPIQLILSGAPNELEINQEFLSQLRHLGVDTQQIFDMAGQTDVFTLPALIDQCDLFISTDSGPYHMAVALRKPCVCWMTYKEVTSYHAHPWVRCLVNPDEATFMNTVQALSTH